MVNPLSNVITVQQVSKRYGKKLILSDVDMTVSEGEIYGLIGPSGAGKTTLVKLIVGMDSASQGKIEVGEYRYRISGCCSASDIWPSRMPFTRN